MHLVISGDFFVSRTTSELWLTVSGATPGERIDIHTSDSSVAKVPSSALVDIYGTTTFNVSPVANGLVDIIVTDSGQRATFKLTVADDTRVCISGASSLDVRQSSAVSVTAPVGTLFNVVTDNPDIVAVTSGLIIGTSGQAQLDIFGREKGQAKISLINSSDAAQISSFYINIIEAGMTNKVTISTSTSTSTESGNVATWCSEWVNIPLILNATVIDENGIPVKGASVKFESDDATVTFDSNVAITDYTGIAFVGAMAMKNEGASIHFTASVGSDVSSPLKVTYLKSTLPAPTFPYTDGTNVINENNVADAYVRIPDPYLQEKDIIRLYWAVQPIDYIVISDGEHVDIPLNTSYLTSGQHLAAYSVSDFFYNTSFSALSHVTVVRDNPGGDIIDQPKPIISNASAGYINQISMFSGVDITVPDSANLLDADSVTIYWNGFRDSLNQEEWNQEQTFEPNSDGTFTLPLKMTLGNEVLTALGEGNGVTHYVIIRNGEVSHSSESVHILVDVKAPGLK